MPGPTLTVTQLAASEPTAEQKRSLYNKYAQSYKERTDSYDEFLSLEYDYFVDAIPGTRVLDLGSGPGRDAAILKEHGLDPLCFDISDKMLALCRERGLETKQGDIEKLGDYFEPLSFDGVWSYTALTTIPKRKVWLILDEVARILKPNGVLMLALIEGEGEGWKPADNKYDEPRYISRYMPVELVQRFGPKAPNNPGFLFEYFSRVPASKTGRNTYLNYIFRKGR